MELLFRQTKSFVQNVAGKQDAIHQRHRLDLAMQVVVASAKFPLVEKRSVVAQELVLGSRLPLRRFLRQISSL